MGHCESWAAVATGRTQRGVLRGLDDGWLALADRGGRRRGRQATGGDEAFVFKSLFQDVAF